MTECLQLRGGGRGHVNIEWGVGWGVEGVVYIYWHPPVANDLKRSNIFQAAGKTATLWTTTSSSSPMTTLFNYLFCLFLPCVPTAWMGGVQGSLFLFFFLLTTFNLRWIMEALMLLLEKRKEALASYLLGLMLLICLFILSPRLYVISPGSPIEQC